MTSRFPLALGVVPVLFLAGRSVAGAVTVDLQPSSVWAVSGSGVGPPCDPPSPMESDWAQVANDGVTLTAEGYDTFCCDCVRRSADFVVGQTATQGAHLTGTFSSTNAGTYADGTFRVILYSGTTHIGQRVYATQQRTNNNCAGSSEEPETIVNAGQPFDIDLTTVSTQSAFDTVRIEMLGYACPVTAPPAPATSATATLSGVQLMAPTLDGGTVGPATPLDVVSPWGDAGPGPFDAGYCASTATTCGGSGGTGSSSGGSSGGGSSGGGCAMASSSAGSLSLGLAAALGLLALARVRKRR